LVNSDNLNACSVDAFVESADHSDVEGRVRKAVRQSWLSLLGPTSLEGSKSFTAAGGDSLSALQLIFSIETLLEQRVAMEVLLDDPTAEELTAAILAQRTSVTDAQDERPLVLIAPGIGGDEPRLLDFRNRLSKALRFEVLEYPDIDRPPAEVSSLETIVGGLLRQIAEKAPAGPVYLVGYSIGGAFALEVARRLEAIGRPPAFLGAVDTLFTEEGQGSKRLLKQVWLASEVGPGWMFQYGAMSLLVQARQYALAVWVIRLFRRFFGVHRAYSMHRLVVFALRERAVRAISPEPRLAGTVTLFRAQDRDFGPLPPDLGWGQFCDSLKVIEIGGDHVSLFLEPHLESNAEAFLTTFKQAISRGHDLAARPREYARGAQDA